MGKKGIIISLEDDHDDQQVLKDVMEELGVTNELLFCDDCDKAYIQLMSLSGKPFLILCDINLPKVNGFELKQRIDSTDRLRREIPFVFLTTSDEKQTIGITGHTSK